MKPSVMKIETYFRLWTGVYLVAVMLAIIVAINMYGRRQPPVETDFFFLKLSGFMAILLASLYALQLWANRRFILLPMCRIRDEASRIATDDSHLGEEIRVGFGKEFQEMTGAFNAMSVKMRQQRDQMEERIGALIRERTIELSTANRRLHNEVAERKQMGEALRESERRLTTLICNLPGIVYRYRHDGDWTLEFISEGCTKLTGYAQSELIGGASRSYNDLILPEERESVRQAIQGALEERRPYQLTYRISTASGEIKWVWEQGTGIWSVTDRLLALEGFITDITERKLAEEGLRKAHGALEEVNLKLERLAREDDLTGLANRRHFNEALQTEINRACRKGEILSLILCDIDFFKRFNDHYGHIAGDTCLQSVGKVLSNTFRRAGEVPARYGGEEFAVILPQVPADKAARLAETLRQEMSAEAVPHEFSDAAPYVTLSIGVVTARVTDQRRAEWFTIEADRALYRSKEGGRNRVTCVAPDSPPLPAPAEVRL